MSLWTTSWSIHSHYSLLTLFPSFYVVNQILPEISKRYFPHLSTGYSSPKLQDLHIGDYLEYLKQHPHEFDVIITGSSRWDSNFVELFFPAYILDVRQIFNANTFLIVAAVCFFFFYSTNRNVFKTRHKQTFKECVETKRHDNLNRYIHPDFVFNFP